MAASQRGEVWIVDLGYAAKVRPCLIVSLPVADGDRALVTLVPHTTSVRGTAFEVTTTERFPKPGAFEAQNLVTIPQAKLIRKLGGASTTTIAAIDNALRRWLSL